MRAVCIVHCENGQNKGIAKDPYGGIREWKAQDLLLNGIIWNIIRYQDRSIYRYMNTHTPSEHREPSSLIPEFNNAWMSLRVYSKKESLNTFSSSFSAVYIFLLTQNPASRGCLSVWRRMQGYTSLFLRKLRQGSTSAEEACWNYAFQTQTASWAKTVLAEVLGYGKVDNNFSADYRDVRFEGQVGRIGLELGLIEGTPSLL